ncbi:MAG: hypothetical protein WCR44_06540 [Verrucomicrobiota bacterium]
MKIPFLPLLVAMSAVCSAAPQIIKEQGTSYLKDAESYIGKTPLIPTVPSGAPPKGVKSPTPTRQPTPTTSRNSSVPRPTGESSEETDAVTSGREYPVAVIHRSTITVGQQIQVPAQYAPPQVIQGSGVTVVPSSPTSFRTVQTGTLMGTDRSGHLTVSDTELSGFVNYGSPIRTGVPAYNQQGQQTGTEVITVSPNPIVQPVTTTIELK